MIGDDEIPAEDADNSPRFDQKEIEKMTGLVVETVESRLDDLVADRIRDIRITGKNVSGSNGKWQVHEPYRETEAIQSPPPELEPFLRRWSIIPGEDPLTVLVKPYGGTVNPSLTGDQAITITNIDTEFPIAADYRIYLVFTITDVSEWTIECELRCDAEWDTIHPFLLDENDDIDYTQEVYYPLAYTVPWNEDVDYAEVDFGPDDNLMVLRCAPDSDLTIMQTNYINSENDREYGVFYPFPPPGDFMFIPPQPA